MDEEPPQRRPKPIWLSRRGKSGVKRGTGGLKVAVNRVKKIVKDDPDIKVIQQDAAVLLARAVEMFLGKLGSDAAAITRRSGRKKLVKKEDLVAAIQEYEPYSFLEEFAFVHGREVKYGEEEEMETDPIVEEPQPVAEEEMEADPIVEPLAEDGAVDLDAVIEASDDEIVGRPARRARVELDSDSDSYAGSLPEPVCGMESD